MKDPKYQSWPDGTRVRFTLQARESMAGTVRFSRPLPTPEGGAERHYIADNTDDTLHDVILRENGERWGTYWLEAVNDSDQPSIPTDGSESG